MNEFRSEVRSWIAEHLPPELAFTASADPGQDPSLLSALRSWTCQLFEAGYVTASWPVEFGGRAASVDVQLVLTEELERSGAPLHLNTLGLQNIAPSIMQWGTPEQCEQHLVAMARADQIWCQGFSEPDSGSDLASLSTRATLDGDSYVVNGQKVWTSMGHWANWCELLVRTDPDAERHRGMSCLLVDLSSDGVEATPITTIAGGQDFAEVYFHDVRVAVEQRLGPEHDGWRVAMTTLSHERAGVATLYLMVHRHLGRLVDDARAAGKLEDPRTRQLLAELHGRAMVLELLAKRAMFARHPGPEGSVIKLLWSETEQLIADAAARVLGVTALSAHWAIEQLSARSLTIAGGTSEINRNIVAERVLGLPRT